MNLSDRIKDCFPGGLSKETLEWYQCALELEEEIYRLSQSRRKHCVRCKNHLFHEINGEVKLSCTEHKIYDCMVRDFEYFEHKHD